MRERVNRHGVTLAIMAVVSAAVIPCVALARKPQPPAPTMQCLFNDSHFHLTNYVQQGTDMGKYVNEIMGDKVCRSTVFGIPLQQTWSYHNSGEFAPTYYLQSDAPLYYYSFTDAYIANAYLKLKPEQRQRLDPMITGFNPADMYAVDHIRRVLETYPGVFTGIGEFTIHKEFVSSKVAGEIASLTDPALDRILDFAGEVGLAVILHSDIDMPFAKAGAEPVFLTQMKDLLRRHPGTTIIWAHIGLGRVVHPVQGQATAQATERNPEYRELVEAMLTDPTLSHLYFDISWDEVAKYAVSSPEAIRNASAMLNRFPDRFLFGTDNVAPADQATQLRVHDMWDPIWGQLTPDAIRKIRFDNYERIFNAARVRVRTWEGVNVK
jgi:predicted TIM-barrel fold metal-dependent hydrolase